MDCFFSSFITPIATESSSVEETTMISPSSSSHEKLKFSQLRREGNKFFAVLIKRSRERFSCSV